MFLRQITDPALAQNAYLLGCQKTGQAVIVDPQRDVDRYLEIAASQDLEIIATVDTHIHADYLSGSRELVERHGLKGYFPGEGGPDWQFEWAKGLADVHFLKGGDTFRIGGIELRALFTPGHTPEHVALLVTDTGSGAPLPIALLSGDFIFVGDVGRPDLLESAAGQSGAQEPAARQLYESLNATASLPAHLQILPAHGAGSSCGKALGAIPSSVLAYERETNPALRLAAADDSEPFVREILSGQPEPPLYFARMKRDNRSGPPLLQEGKLPQPQRIAADGLVAWINDPSRVILDLRGDRKTFAGRHLKGSLFTPLAKGKLPSVAGSYVKEDAAILLVAEECQLAEAVRQLIRIGLDRVENWIPADEALSATGLATSISRIETAALEKSLQSTPNARVLDVRGVGEYAESHVKDALHIAHTRLAARLDEIDPAATWFIHCGSGLRAAFAAA
ncbi:MAG: metallo-beta-lactamase superfamily protein, partial [Akkermansiaceae bacterium]|nr:metallo-beta-lactamase superfamily protein [Akkermansiaceae bacterium]